MSDASRSHGDLAALLARECDAVGALVALLRDERRALRDDDIERLVTLAEPKLARARDVATLEERRRTLFAGLGDAPAAPAPVAGLWSRLRETARVAERMNRENGILLRLRSERVDRAVAFLAGVLGGHSATYDLNGLTRPASAPRMLGVA